MKRTALKPCLCAALILGACKGSEEPDPGTPPEEVLVPFPDHLDAAIAAATNGGESDFDGDGMTDLVTVVESGQTTTKVVVNGRELLVVVRRADGSADKTGDYDLNGSTDFTEHEEESATRFTRSGEQDTNFDGISDLRESYERDATSKQSHYRREVLLEGVWTVEVDRSDESEQVAQGLAGCDDVQPKVDDVAVEENILVGNITIASCIRDPSSANGCNSPDPKGACNAQQYRRIQNAMVQLFQDQVDALKPIEDINIPDTTVIECLRKRHPHFLEALIHHLTKGEGKGARIACGITCPPNNEGRLRGITHDYNRSRIGLNMNDPNPDLVTTILHELIHSAGYDGSADHNDINGNQDDEVYKCSRWCTGRSIMNGAVNVDDCFKCSGTKAAREECCQGKNTCSDGCCEGPCRVDGTCTWRDPCDPRQANGDFSKCVFEGTALIAGYCFSSMTWVVDRTDFANKVTLIPIMGHTDCGEGLLNPDCSVTPTDVPIAMGDGQLILDYSGDNPRYSGFGNTVWPLQFNCPDAPPMTIQMRSAWFAQETPILFEPGKTIAGMANADGSELKWYFAYRR